MLLFLMGLTHDIGKTFMLKAFSEEPAVKGLDMKLIVANIQEAHLGISNIMLKRWGFNDAFIRAVSLHEKNEFDSGVSQDCLVVNLANMIDPHHRLQHHGSGQDRAGGAALRQPPGDGAGDGREARRKKPRASSRNSPTCFSLAGTN